MIAIMAVIGVFFLGCFAVVEINDRRFWRDHRKLMERLDREHREFMARFASWSAPRKSDDLRKDN